MSATRQCSNVGDPHSTIRLMIVRLTWPVDEDRDSAATSVAAVIGLSVGKLGGERATCPVKFR